MHRLARPGEPEEPKKLTRSWRPEKAMENLQRMRQKVTAEELHKRKPFNPRPPLEYPARKKANTDPPEPQTEAQSQSSGTELEKLKLKVEDLKGMLDVCYNQDVPFFKKQIAARKKQCNNLETYLEKAYENAASLRSQIKGFQDAAEVSTKQEENLTKQIAALHKVCEKQHEKLRREYEYSATHISQLNALKDVAKVSKKQEESLRKEIAALKKECDKQKIDLQKAHQDRANLRSHITAFPEDLVEELEISEEQLKKAHEDCAELQAKVADLENVEAELQTTQQKLEAYWTKVGSLEMVELRVKLNQTKEEYCSRVQREARSKGGLAKKLQAENLRLKMELRALKRRPLVPEEETHGWS